MSPTQITLPNTSFTPMMNGTKFSTPTSSGSKGKPRRNKRKLKFGGLVKVSIVTQAPANKYLSLCCQAPATKPQAGHKENAGGKPKDHPKGLGHWHCSNCGKPTKVTVKKLGVINENNT